MSARIVAITQPLDPADAPDPQALLAYFARVSSSANQGNHATGGRLIRSLIRRKEWSPLEMVSLTVEIVTTRDIARQMLRHRSFHFQEFSQRYAEVTDELVLREGRAPHPTDRQMSLPLDNPAVLDWWERAQVGHREHVKALYKAALNMGVAKEQARALLPEGMTPSRLYMAGTLRDWFHYCGLRSEEATQKEHREIARAIWALIVEQFPVLADVS